MPEILQIDSLVVLRFHFHLGQVSRFSCAIPEVFLLSGYGRCKVQPLHSLDASSNVRSKTIFCDKMGTKHRSCGDMLLLVLVWILSRLENPTRLANQNRFRFDQSHHHHATSRPDHIVALGYANSFSGRDRILSATPASHNHGCFLPRMA